MEPMEWVATLQVVGLLVTWTCAILSIAAYLSTRIQLGRRRGRLRRHERQVAVLGTKAHQWRLVEIQGDQPEGTTVERCETCGLMRMCVEIGSFPPDAAARILVDAGAAPPWMAGIVPPSRN